MPKDIPTFVEFLADNISAKKLGDLLDAMDEQAEFEGACPCCGGQSLTIEEDDEQGIDHDDDCPIALLNGEFFKMK